MPQHVICSSCRQMLVIRDYSPERLTCPRCLSPLHNPRPHEAVGTPVALGHPRPTPTIQPTEVEQETKLDLHVSARNMAVLAVMILAMGILLIYLHAEKTGSFCIMVAVILLGVSAIVERVPDPQADSMSVMRGCRQAVLIGIGIALLLLGACGLLMFGIASSEGFH